MRVKEGCRMYAEMPVAEGELCALCGLRGGDVGCKRSHDPELIKRGQKLYNSEPVTVCTAGYSMPDGGCACRFPVFGPLKGKCIKGDCASYVN